MTNKKGSREVKKNFLVGLRCKDWGKGCDCHEYIIEGAREILKERYNCIHEDACFYKIIKAKNVVLCQFEAEFLILRHGKDFLPHVN